MAKLEVSPSTEGKKKNKNKNREERWYRAFLNVTNIVLNEEQREWIKEPYEVKPAQKTALSLHWHPEFVSFDLIRERIDRTFPNKDRELFIPTQHNDMLTYDGIYWGVEVDCYSPEFSRKVQLLCHFHHTNVDGDKAHTWRNMLQHTYTYRAGQLYEFIDTILLASFKDHIEKAAEMTGADKEIIEWVRERVEGLKNLIIKHEKDVPAEMLRNKLLRNFIEEVGQSEVDRDFLTRAQNYLTCVKKIVKQRFSPEYFYHTQEIIEEVRSLGGGIIIPHPEQFWPILMADYDIDGIEVWNPQSQRYTDFIIEGINRQNSKRRSGEKELLMVFGDDCHMGEKVKAPEKRNSEKWSRQIGVQAWEDLSLRKNLMKAGLNRDYFIDRYLERLH